MKSNSVSVVRYVYGVNISCKIADRRESTGSDSSEPPAKTLAIDCAQLVKCDKPRAIAETTAYTPGKSLPFCGHWRYDDSPQMLV